MKNLEFMKSFNLFQIQGTKFIYSSETSVLFAARTP